MKMQTKKLIGVDGNEANLANRVGVNTYAYETLKALAESETEWGQKVSFEIILKNNPLPHMPKETENFKYRILPGGGMWILKTLTPYLMKNRKDYDVFWTPSHYVPPVPFIKKVCSIMDLGYLSSKSQFKAYDYWQLTLWTIFSLIVSKKIIAISDATKNDIEKKYPFTKGKVVTTLLGYDKKRFNTKITESEIKKVKKKYKLSENYILFLSTLKPSKNIEGLLKAWHLIYKSFPETKLVIAGKKGWLFENIFKIVKDLNLEQSVIFTDFFEEEEKPPLIAGAKVFVLPSFWEGFGLDVLSSMACGVPVIVSNRGSLPEVAGDVGLVIDPYDPEDIAASLQRILTMKNVDYGKLSKNGVNWVEKFSWGKTAMDTIGILKD